MVKKKKKQNETKLYCERCHRVGHVIQNCYALICEYCKKVGHEFIECRTLQKDKKYMVDTARQLCRKAFSKAALLGEYSWDEPSTSSETNPSVDTEMSTLSTVGAYREYLRPPFKEIIEISAAELKGEKAKMLVTQNTPVSIIKIGKLQDNVTAAKESLILDDVFGSRVKTICLVCLSIRVNNKTVLHPCRVISDDFYVETDGVLGCDFVVRTKVKFGEYVELAGIQIPFIDNEYVRGILKGNDLIDILITDSESKTVTEDQVN